jgi:SAM-dependent methyltransferase
MDMRGSRASTLLDVAPVPESAIRSAPPPSGRGHKPFLRERQSSTLVPALVNRARGLLREAGLSTYAVDASSTMVATFRECFPGVPIEQNTVEASEFFDRTFDGVLSWGLLFLLQPAAQALVIEKVARALNPGGRFLFTAPKEPLEWLDAMTDRPSQSLGAQTYERLLRDAGLTWVTEAEDEGGNHYYFVEKREPLPGGI